MIAMLTELKARLLRLQESKKGDEASDGQSTPAALPTRGDDPEVPRHAESQQQYSAGATLETTDQPSTWTVSSPTAGHLEGKCALAIPPMPPRPWSQQRSTLAQQVQKHLPKDSRGPRSKPRSSA